tara:strand:- start:1084 stop:1518 length:435 start_codon:yes stop_codon:yes gene_type:complete
MRRDLTRLWLGPGKNRTSSRLLFGTPRVTRRIGQGREVALFGPGDVFAFETASGRLPDFQCEFVGIVKCGGAGANLSRIPRVEPGGFLLLSAIGKHHAARALEAIARLEKARPPGEIPAAFWQRLSTQLQAGLPVADLLERTVW